MSLSHWLYLIGIIIVVLTMIFRRNVIIPCLIFTFLIGWFYLGSFVGGIQTIFNASLVAAKDLFGIFLIIGLMVAMLKSLSVSGADQLLVKPLQAPMKNPLVSYIVLILGTAIISLFFWPTPAVPLIGALLAPAAIRAGLPPIMAAVAISLAGQGMALSGDVVIQGAPGLSASSAGIPVDLLISRSGILALVTGVVAITLVWIMNKKEIDAYKGSTQDVEYLQKTKEETKLEKEHLAPFFRNLLVVAVVLVIIALFVFEIRGGDASALLGGMALLIMIVTTLMVKGVEGLDFIGDCIAEGLVFAFRVMGPIIPIAGFFFLGNPEAVASILSPEAPGFLFDIGNIIAGVIPATGFLAGFGLLIIGIITGLDGSGFSGLPLTGTLAGAIAASNASAAASLAAIGQMGAIWAGGGTIIAWSSLVAVAGVVGVPVLDLVRKNLIPVIVGLIVSTIVGVLLI
ncbi:MAG: hypothetical protein RBT41_08930 [Clostridia bacterium]|jgi:hypothetical protein|nr:hypothetical protein [Clostridia bacterium]